jgi:predicted nucleic acid-binding protein
MRTAIDSSVLHAILNAEPDGTEWLLKLERLRNQGSLVVCEIVYAEVSTGFESRAALDTVFEKLGIQFDPISPAAAHVAGRTFARYRKAGGPREHLLPDFLIGAHAQVQADGLAAMDRGYLRRYFASVSLVSL